jgi:cation diffusion facilitator family transporter
MTLPSEQQAREKGFAAASSVAAAIFLTALKLGVGIMTGSLGILAEAAHSALDLGAALITFFAIRVSDRPADESHLYGHGKVENLSALAETLLLLLTCLWIIYEAIQRLFFETVEVNPSVWAFLVMGISILVDFSRSRVLYRAAKKYNSQALEADALHFSTDIWSSSVVIIGLALVWLGEQIGQKSALLRADAIAALVVALIVIYVSIQLGKRTIDALLDTAPRGLADRITAAVAQLGDVRQVLRARVRGSGSQIFVDLRVAVPRHLSFEASHAVTHQIRDAARAVAPNADVVITTVPSAENEGIFETIQSVAARNHFAVHNISTHLTKRGIWIDLDLEVAPSLTFDQAHALATDLETRLRAELVAASDAPRIADINVHIEPRAQELVKGRELLPQEAAQYIEQIRAISHAIPHVRECRDIDVQALDGQVYLAFHLRLDAALSIADAHSVTEEMENRLRREFPALGRVVIHAEPAQVKSQKLKVKS